MSRKTGFVIGVCLAVASAGAAYLIVTKTEAGRAFQDAVRRSARGSQEQLQAMTEEVALKTAKITRNPKATQEFTRAQWQSIGF